MWESLLKAIDRTDLIDDPRYTDQRARNKHFDEVYTIIKTWTEKRTKFEAMEILGRAGVPCGAVLDTGDILANEHLRARGMITTVEHPARGTFTMPGCAVQLSDSPTKIKPAPLLGQHNEEIYGALLGFTRAELAGLKEEGII
jgi:formyl-CoA transferase